MISVHWRSLADRKKTRWIPVPDREVEDMLFAGMTKNVSPLVYDAGCPNCDSSPSIRVSAVFVPINASVSPIGGLTTPPVNATRNG